MPQRPVVPKIHYTTPYLKAYTKLPARIQKLQKEKEVLFRLEPFHPSLKTHKLKGKYQNFHSYSVAYHWRVLFRFISDSEIVFYDVGTHGIYR